jgi:hypothetical protein
LIVVHRALENPVTKTFPDRSTAMAEARLSTTDAGCRGAPSRKAGTSRTKRAQTAAALLRCLAGPDQQAVLSFI